MSAIKVDERAVTTKSGLKQMRREGVIPGVVYGSDRASESIAVNAKELMQLLRGGSSGVVNMELQGEQAKPVMITEIQRDPLNGHILHVDLRQVNMEESVRTQVTIQYIGTPVGVKEGGFQQIQAHEVEIACKPKNIPEAIEVDVSRLTIGESITVEEISPPPGVEILAEPHDVLVTVVEQQKVEEAPADEASAEAEAADGATEDNDEQNDNA